jgi:hypothetical protein
LDLLGAQGSSAVEQELATVTEVRIILENSELGENGNKVAERFLEVRVHFLYVSASPLSTSHSISKLKR